MTRNDKCSHGALLTEGCEDCGAVPQSASTIVATTPPDLAEHPYYKHVRSCEHCSGPHGHCAEGLRLKNADVNPFTERARQLVEQCTDVIPTERGWGADLLRVNAQKLAPVIASFAAEAATQGQAVGIERAADAAKKFADYQRDLHKRRRLELQVDFTDPELRFIEGTAAGADVVEGSLRLLSPGPSYLNQIRNEVATAALERGRQESVEIVKDFLNLSGKQWAAKYKMSYNQGGLISAIITGGRAAKVDAAIGDDKKEQP